jgi:hypothetical protein
VCVRMFVVAAYACDVHVDDPARHNTVATHTCRRDWRQQQRRSHDNACDGCYQLAVGARTVGMCLRDLRAQQTAVTRALPNVSNDATATASGAAANAGANASNKGGMVELVRVQRSARTLSV